MTRDASDKIGANFRVEDAPEDFRTQMFSDCDEDSSIDFPKSYCKLTLGSITTPHLALTTDYHTHEHDTTNNESCLNEDPSTSQKENDIMFQDQFKNKMPNSKKRPLVQKKVEGGHKNRWLHE